MEISDLKDRIIQDNNVAIILEALKMHTIRESQLYYSCGMPDGDNQKSTIIYKDSLVVEAHTRNISDKYGNSDILSLVMFIKDFYISKALKWMCDICGYDYYGQVTNKPKAVLLFNELFDMRSNSDVESDKYVAKPIDEYLLTYLSPLNSKMFHKDNIDYSIQRMFDIRYDGMENRIVIPIRDENGVLVGLKGRLNKRELCKFDNKYMYLTECNKSSILFGLDLAYEHIKREGIVYVCESEKGVLQGFSKGIYNVVAIGGKKLSKMQVKKLTYLGVEVCLCFDDGANIGKNDEIDDNYYRRQKYMFLDSIKVSAIIDRKNKILGKKESPFDNLDDWNELLKMKRDIK